MVVIKKTTRIVRTARVTSSASSNDTDRSGKSSGLDYIPTILLECLLLPTLVLVCCLLHSVLYLHSNVIRPKFQALQWTPERAQRERTYPALNCSHPHLVHEAVTLSSPNDLFLSKEMPPNEATDFVMQHGGAVVPDLIPPAIAGELRDYLLQRSASLNAQHLPVLAHEYRRSIAITALEHDSIPRALRSIASSSLLEGTLEGLLGKNPALLALSTIVSEPGAGHQRFHVDKPPSGSAMQYAQTFAPNYALLIPLQDTTADMGATAMAPGTHKCHEMNRSLAEEHGFPVVHSGTGIWSAGYGLLYHGQVRHRGSAHVGGPTRAVLILTFGSKPDGIRQGRQLPLLSYFALRWDMWGFTWNDLKDPERFMAYPWLRSLGLWKDPLAADWGWTALDDFCALFADHEYSNLGASLLRKLNNVVGLRRLVNGVMRDYTEEDHDNLQEGEAPYESYFVQLFIRLRIAMLIVTVGVFWKYVEFIVAKATSTKSIYTPVLRLVLICSCVALTVAGLTQRLERLDAHLPTHPQLDLPQTTATLVEDEPQLNDVLISSALDNASPQTAAYARILDFHPGNQKWRQLASQLAGSHQSDSNAVADSVALEQALQSGIEGRFLRQVDDGWVKMNMLEIKEATLALVNSRDISD